MIFFAYIYFPVIVHFYKLFFGTISQVEGLSGHLYIDDLIVVIDFKRIFTIDE